MEVPVICNIAHEYKHSTIHTKQSIFYIYLTISLKTPKKTHAHHAHGRNRYQPPPQALQHHRLRKPTAAAELRHPKTTKKPNTTTATNAPFSPSFESHRLRKPTGGLISPSWDPLALTRAALPSYRRTQATTQATKSALDNGCLPQLSY